MKDKIFIVIGAMVIVFISALVEPRMPISILLAAMAGAYVASLKYHSMRYLVSFIIILIDAYYLILGLPFTGFIYLIVGLNALVIKYWISHYQQLLLENNKFVLIYTLAISIESLAMYYYISYLCFFGDTRSQNFLLAVILCILYSRFQKSVTHIQNIKI